MAQTRPSPTLSRGFTRLGRFLAPYGVAAETLCAGPTGSALAGPGGQNTMSAIAHATPQHTGSVTEREKPRGSGHRPAPVRVTVLDDQICQSPRQHAGQRLVVHCDACVLRRVGGELLLSSQSVEIIKFGDPGSGR